MRYVGLILLLLAMATIVGLWSIENRRQRWRRANRQIEKLGGLVLWSEDLSSSPSVKERFFNRPLAVRIDSEFKGSEQFCGDNLLHLLDLDTIEKLELAYVNVDFDHLCSVLNACKRLNIVNLHGDLLSDAEIQRLRQAFRGVEINVFHHYNSDGR